MSNLTNIGRVLGYKTNLDPNSADAGFEGWKKAVRAVAYNTFFNSWSDSWGDFFKGNWKWSTFDISKNLGPSYPFNPPTEEEFSTKAKTNFESYATSQKEDKTVAIASSKSEQEKSEILASENMTSAVSTETIEKSSELEGEIFSSRKTGGFDSFDIKEVTSLEGTAGTTSSSPNYDKPIFRWEEPSVPSNAWSQYDLRDEDFEEAQGPSKENPKSAKKMEYSETLAFFFNELDHERTPPKETKKTDTNIWEQNEILTEEAIQEIPLMETEDNRSAALREQPSTKDPENAALPDKDSLISKESNSPVSQAENIFASNSENFAIFSAETTAENVTIMTVYKPERNNPVISDEASKELMNKGNLLIPGNDELWDFHAKTLRNIRKLAYGEKFKETKELNPRIMHSPSGFGTTGFSCAIVPSSLNRPEEFISKKQAQKTASQTASMALRFIQNQKEEFPESNRVKILSEKRHAPIQANKKEKTSTPISSLEKIPHSNKKATKPNKDYIDDRATRRDFNAFLKQEQLEKEKAAAVPSAAAVPHEKIETSSELEGKATSLTKTAKQKNSLEENRKKQLKRACTAHISDPANVRNAALTAAITGATLTEGGQRVATKFAKPLIDTGKKLLDKAIEEAPGALGKTADALRIVTQESLKALKGMEVPDVTKAVFNAGQDALEKTINNLKNNPGAQLFAGVAAGAIVGGILKNTFSKNPKGESSHTDGSTTTHPKTAKDSIEAVESKTTEDAPMLNSLTKSMIEKITTIDPSEESKEFVLKELD